MLLNLYGLFNLDKLCITSIVITILLFSIVSQPSYGIRPQYVYDNANLINSKYKDLIEDYLRDMDAQTSAEVVMFTIPSFIGHGIKKDNQEIQDRDTLANYIFNEVTLNGIKGIGKKDKDNGVLVLYSLERDSGGGSMRIEIGRGLEGNITDGTAGAILDSYLVPAGQDFEATRNPDVLGEAFLTTVIAIGEKIGYKNQNQIYQEYEPRESESGWEVIILMLVFLVIIAVIFYLGRRRRFGSRGQSGNDLGGSGFGWGGLLGGLGWAGGGGGFSGGQGGGGGYSGGGGSSGGGGAGR
jgi:uncharacterized protein